MMLHNRLCRAIKKLMDDGCLKLLRFDQAQPLTPAEQAQAQANLGISGGGGAVVGGPGEFSSLLVLGNSAMDGSLAVGGAISVGGPIEASNIRPVFMAAVHQEGTDEPVMTVLQNTSGFMFTLVREGVGNYRLAVTPWANAMPLHMTAFFASPGNQGGTIHFLYQGSEANRLVITRDAVGTIADGILSYTHIKIEFYA